MSEFDLKAFCEAGGDDTTTAICTVNDTVDGVVTGVDTFFLLFAVSFPCLPAKPLNLCYSGHCPLLVIVAD